MSKSFTAKWARNFDIWALFQLVFNHFFIGQRRLLVFVLASIALEQELLELVFQVPMQRCTCVGFFANWAANDQVALSMLTNKTCAGRVL